MNYYYAQWHRTHTECGFDPKMRNMPEIKLKMLAFATAQTIAIAYSFINETFAWPNRPIAPSAIQRKQYVNAIAHLGT